MQQSIRRRIGNGLTTMVWKVPWLPDMNNGYITTEAPEQLQHILVHGLLHENQKMWDKEVVSDLFNERDQKLILQIPIPVRNKEDSWYWGLEDKGDFSVKSCYRKLCGEFACVEKRFWMKLWSLKLPGKILNFLWRASSNVLPTAAALRGRRVEIPDVCQWCHQEVEDAVHTLFSCSIAKEVWGSVGLRDMVRISSNDTVFTILKRAFTGGTREQSVMVGLLCWSLWSRRNKWLWDKVNMSVFGIKAMALNLVADWKRARQTEATKRNTTNSQCRTWCRPQEGWVKINLDASFYAGTDTIGIGCVVRDDRGCFLRARTNVLQGTTQVREAEAWSLREALEWVRKWRTTKCIFESDAKLLVDAIHGDRGRSNFDTIVEACSENLEHFEEVSIVFVSRSANSVAHALAQAARSMSGPMEWFDTAPEFISCNLALEAF